jgi:hypothetical protein
MVENTENKPKKPSAIENLGKLGMQVGEMVGKTFTEYFTGKPLTEEEKARRARLKELKLVQEEAQFQKDLELARQGNYVPPAPKTTTKKKEENIFSNLGKHNPLEDFGNTKSLGSHNFGVEDFSGVRQFKPDDLSINGYEQNPIGKQRRRD